MFKQMFDMPPDTIGFEAVGEIDTFDPAAARSAERSGVADPVAVGPRSVVVLQGAPGR